MTHAAIVATYSDQALAVIIRQLSASGEWRARLKAAQIELRKRNRKS
jgi:hypothetical protein